VGSGHVFVPGVADVFLDFPVIHPVEVLPVVKPTRADDGALAAFHSGVIVQVFV